MADFNGQGFDPTQTLGEAPADAVPGEEAATCEEFEEVTE